MKISEGKVDGNKVENGAWVGDIPEMEGLRLKVRGQQNKDWRKLQTKLLNKVPRKKKLGGQLDQEEADRITRLLLLETSLLDWEGLEDDNGEPIPYTKEMAEKLLTDPDYARFHDAVEYASRRVGDQAAEDVKEAAGNLVTLSPGATGGERKSKVS